MLMKNWTLNKYNPDYFFDFEHATASSMTNDGSATSPTWSSSGGIGRFDISQTYYGMWSSDHGFLNDFTGSVSTTTSGFGSYLDNGDYTINFFIEFSKHGVNATKNIFEINFQNNSLILQLFGNTGTANAYKLNVRSGGTDLFQSTQQHWSYSGTSPVVSGGFLSTPTGWSGNRPGFMMVSLRQSGGTVELYINGELDNSASFSAPSGTFTNFRLFGTSNSINLLMDQLSIAPSSVYTEANLTDLWNLFLLGEIPVDPATANAQFSADPSISIVSSVNISGATASADAQFSADPNIIIEESNTADPMTASAESVVPSISVIRNVNFSHTAATASAQFSADPNIVTSGNPFIQQWIDDRNPQIWYHLDESSASAIANQGSVTGNPSFTSNGIITLPDPGVSNTGLGIGPGAGYINTSASTQWSEIQDGSFAINYFIRLLDTDNSSNIISTFTLENNDGSQRLRTYLNKVSSSYLVHVNIGGDTAIIGTTDLDDDLWHLVSLRRESGVLKLFVDGVQEGSSSSNSLTLTNVTRMRLGGGATGVYFELDEFTIFPTTFTETDITELYGVYEGNVTIRPGTVTATAELPNAIAGTSAFILGDPLLANAELANPLINIAESLVVDPMLASALMNDVQNIDINPSALPMTASAESPNASVVTVISITNTVGPFTASALLRSVVFIRPATATAEMGFVGAQMQPILPYETEVIGDLPVIYHKMDSSNLIGQENYGLWGQPNLSLYAAPNVPYQQLNFGVELESSGIDDDGLKFLTNNTVMVYQNYWHQGTPLNYNSGFYGDTREDTGQYIYSEYKPGLYSVVNQYNPTSALGTSIEFWFKPSPLTEYEPNKTYNLWVLGATPPGGNTWLTGRFFFEIITRADKTLDFQIRHTDAGKGAAGAALKNGDQVYPQFASFPRVPLTPNEWNHIVFTYNDAGIQGIPNSPSAIYGGIRGRVYLNGVLINDISRFNTPVVSWLEFFQHIGWGLNIGGGSAIRPAPPGTLDEFAVYNQTLTQDQVTRHYASATNKIVAGDILSATARLVPALNALTIFDAPTLTASAQFSADPIVDFGPLTLIYANTMIASANIRKSTAPDVDPFWKQFDNFIVKNDLYEAANIRGVKLKTIKNDGIGSSFGLNYRINNTSSPIDSFSRSRDQVGDVVASSDGNTTFYQVFGLNGNLSTGNSNNASDNTVGRDEFAFPYQWDSSGIAQEFTPSYEYINNIDSNSNYYERKLLKLNSEQQISFDRQASSGSLIGTTRSYTGFASFIFLTSKSNCALLSPIPTNFIYEFDNNENALNTAKELNVINENNDEIKTMSKLIDRTGPFVYIENGKIKLFFYDQHNNKYEFTGTTNVSDGKAHHLILNRTVSGMNNSGKEFKNTKSCLELWIDGNLEFRTNKLTENDLMTSNFVLGGAKEELIQWDQEKADLYGTDFWDYPKDTNDNLVITGSSLNDFVYYKDPNSYFEGYVGTYIASPIRPLFADEIELMYQSLLNNKIVKCKNITVSALFVEPTINTNKQSTLRLYWSKQFDKQFGTITSEENVDTYSVNYKLLTNPGLTFNLDKTKSKYNLKTDVVTIVDHFIDINNPGEVAVNIGYGFNSDTGKDPYSSIYTGYKGYTLPEVVLNDRKIEVGDKVLLLNQMRKEYNTVWIYNGPSKAMTRPSELNQEIEFKDAVVYVNDGSYAGTYWIQIEENVELRKFRYSNSGSGISSELTWKKIDTINDELNDSKPIIDDSWRYSQTEGQRLIDLENDIDIDKYKTIIFMNYPETDDDIESLFQEHDKTYAKKEYDKFINKLKDLVKGGKSLYVGSPKLTIDLGLASNVTSLNKEYIFGDTYSYNNDPLSGIYDQSLYFNTHTYNQHKLVDTLDNFEYFTGNQIIDFISLNKNISSPSEYSIKYLIKDHFEIDDEFYIATIPLLNEQTSSSNVTYSKNKTLNRGLYAIKPSDLLAGRAITVLPDFNGNNFNPFNNYITTFAVDSSTGFEEEGMSGKIYVNLVEDALTACRDDYNNAVIQDENATWQYQTYSLNKQINPLFNIEQQGQTLPTNGGGGSFVQSSTNCSDGTIRINTDFENVVNISNIYPTLSEETAENIQIITLNSMAYVGIDWLRR